MSPTSGTGAKMTMIFVPGTTRRGFFLLLRSVRGRGVEVGVWVGGKEQTPRP